jgi:L,D-transpeptidase catalytic domain
VRRALVLVAGLALFTAAPALAQDPPDPPDPPRIADGVTVGGLLVGDMTREEATAALRARFNEPLRVRLRKRSFRVPLRNLGASAQVYRAVTIALAAPEGTQVRLAVAIKARKLRRWANMWARHFDHSPRNSSLFLKRSLRPQVTKARPGRKLRRSYARRVIRSELRRHERGPVTLRTRKLRPKVRRKSFGPVVVIRRDSRSLRLYRGLNRRGMRLRRVFRVAVGQPSYPTPLGRFQIVSKQRNPWWYPPNTGWASGSSPIPPGPGNPLGTRWMGLSVGAVGIHGTYNSASIGGFASHGCVRMYLHEAEWLFERVRLGTTVFVVGA